MSLATIALFEVALLGIAMQFMDSANLPVDLAATPLNLAIGLAVGLTLAAIAALATRQRGPFSLSLKHDLDVAIGVVREFSVFDMAFVALLAGLCEEALFRGGLQTWLTGPLGPVGAMAVAALTFGAAHIVSVTYAIAAMIIGMALGATFHLTGSLTAVMVAHAAYDFALLYWGIKVRKAD